MDKSAQPPAPKMLLLKPNMIAPISATSPGAVSDISITPIDELLSNIFSKRRNPGCLAIQLYVDNRVVCAVLRKDRLVCEAPQVRPTHHGCSLIAKSVISKSHAFFEIPINRPFLGRRRGALP